MVLPSPGLEVHRNLGEYAGPEAAHVVRWVVFLPGHGDADVVPVAGDCVGHLRDAGASGELAEVSAHLEAVGVAGLGQQPLGLLGVVLRHIVDPLVQPGAEGTGMEDGADGLGEAEVRPGGNRGLVYRQVQGATHLHIQRRVVYADVGRRPFGDVHATLVNAPGRLGRLAYVYGAAEGHGQHSVGLVGLGPGVAASGVHAPDTQVFGLVQVFRQRPGQIVHRVHLLAGQQGEAGRWVGNRQKLHLAELGLVPVLVVGPEVIPAVEQDPVVGFPFRDGEGAAPGGVLQVGVRPHHQTVGVAVPVEVIPVAAQVPHPGGLAAVGLDEDLCGADYLHVGGKFLGLGAVPQRGVVTGRLNEVAAEAQQVIRDRLSVGWRAVLETGVRV